MVNREKGVRVRGIYATAITQLLISNGVKVADATDVIKSRFSDYAFSPCVPALTLKDRDDHHALVCIGDRGLLLRVLDIIKGVNPFAVARVSPVEVYSTYKCIVVKKVNEGKYVVDLGGGLKGYLLSSVRLNAGDEVVAHVVKPSNGLPLLRPGAMVCGYYARLVEGGRVTFSRFINSPERRKLLTSIWVSMCLDGWGIEWRSAAKEGSLEEIMAEVSELKKLALNVKKQAESAQAPTRLSPGEAFAEVLLPLQAKYVFDDVRGKRIYTIPLHHFFKSLGREPSSLVDLLEEHFGKYCDKTALARGMLDYYLSKVRDMRKMPFKIIHEKIAGEKVNMYGWLEDVSQHQVPVLTIKREIKGSGVYDGLDVKKEAGDYALTFMAPFSPVVIHVYMSAQNRVKGLYANINTPAEVGLDGSTSYVDLSIDVTWANGNTRVVDAEELDQLCGSGLVGEDMCKYAKSLAQKLYRNLSNLSPESVLANAREIVRTEAEEILKTVGINIY